MNIPDLNARPIFLPPFSPWHALHNLRIGITGQRGTLGSLLTSRFTEHGIEILPFSGDVRDEDALTRWIGSTRPDVLFHLAAIVPLQDVEEHPETAMMVNAVSNLPLAGALAKYAPSCWLFYASTSHVYTPHSASEKGASCISESDICAPISLYGSTKLAGEHILWPLAKHYGITTCIGRIFSYFHERQAPSFLVPNLLKRAKEAMAGSLFEVYDATSVRDILHADVIVDALLYLCAKRHFGIINVGSGHGQTIRSLADHIVNLTGKQLTMHYVDADRPTSLVANVERLREVIRTYKGG